MPFTVTTTTSTDRFFGGGPGLPPVLLNHPAQSVAPIDGWKSALFGLPFLLAGLFIEAAALNLIPSHERHAPNWVIGIIGLLFLSGGVFLVGHGIFGILRKAAQRREAAQFPGQPWYADYHWRAEGISYSAFSAMLGALLAALVWSAFFAPFFWVGLHERGLVRIFFVFALLFSPLSLIFWYRWLKILADLVRYGNTFLAFDEFPFYLGGTLRARLRAPRNLSAISSLTFTLRCIQERYVTTGTGNDRSTRVVCYELYRAALTLDQNRLANFTGAEIPLEFPLPNDKLPTTLADAPPTYWQIEARGQAHGPDHLAYFLVPVYKKI